jgi:hypothetical protein
MRAPSEKQALATEIEEGPESRVPRRGFVEALRPATLRNAPKRFERVVGEHQNAIGVRVISV